MRRRRVPLVNEAALLQDPITRKRKLVIEW